MSALRQFSSLLLPFLFAAASFGQMSFSGPHPYSVGSAAGDVVSADLNHDGHTDLLATVPYDRGGDLFVLMNNGDGTFRGPVSSSTGDTPSRMAVADFNGDNNLDVAMINLAIGGESSTLYVRVMYGDGLGGFSSSAAYGEIGGAAAITTGDFNNDRRTDIATVAGNTSVSIFTNTGSGFSQNTFPVPTYFQSNFGAGFSDEISDLVAGEFNADGKMDLAYVDHCVGCDVPEEKLFILTNNGAASFTGQRATMISNGSDFSSTGLRRLRSTDVDLDGRSDLYFTFDGCHTPCSGAWVLFNNGGNNFTRVGPGVTAGVVPLDAVVDDFNNDGIMDLAVSEIPDGNSSSPRPAGFDIYRGQTGRTFSSLAWHSNSPNPTSGRPDFIASGFFTADGKKDISTFDTGNFEIYFNQSSTISGGCLYPSGVGVSFCAPASGASVSSPVRVRASYHPRNYPAHRVEIWIDGVKKQQIFNDRVNSSFALASGSHTITISGVDVGGKNYKNTHTFTVGGTSTSCTPPSSAGVRICSPTAGSTVSSPVSFKAAARAASGNIASMRIYVDSVSRFTQSNPSASTTQSISTSLSLTAGSHAITIIGYQSTGGTVKASETITVH